MFLRISRPKTNSEHEAHNIAFDERQSLLSGFDELPRTVKLVTRVAAISASEASPARTWIYSAIDLRLWHRNRYLRLRCVW